MDRILCQIAETLIEFTTDGPLLFYKHDQIRGFAVSEGQPDYRIRVSYADESRMASPEPHVGIFTSERTQQGYADHQWTLRTYADGSECIEVEHVDNERFKRTQLLLSNKGDGELLICPTTANYERIPAYVFPIVNVMLSRIVAKKGGFLTHCSVVDDGGRGYLFTAVSGTGKSTMARLWKSCGATIINDDMLALLPTANGRFEAHNIPMQLYVDTPRKARLSGIFLISQSKENFIRPVKGARAVLRLMANTLQQPIDSTAASQHVNRVAAACTATPIFELGFRPDTDIVDEVRRLNL